MILSGGHFRVRFAEGSRDLADVRRLRGSAFRASHPPAATDDSDDFDRVCRHMLVEDRRTGQAVASWRMLALPSGRDFGQSYSAQFYNLSALSGHAAPVLEIGRLCVREGQRDPDILRVIWAAITRFADAAGARLLFGCASFGGCSPEPYLDAFAHLASHHLAPRCWSPGSKAAEIVALAPAARRLPNPRNALRAMPPLLRSYLKLGGWVSDHAVIDRDLGTLHVFTGVEVAAIPAARKRRLRDLAA